MQYLVMLVCAAADVIIPLCWPSRSAEADTPLKPWRHWVQLIWAPIITAIAIPVALITHFAILKRFNPPQQVLSYRGATDADNMDEVCCSARMFKVTRSLPWCCLWCGCSMP